MPVTIRPIQHHEYEAAAALAALVDPEHAEGAQTWRLADARPPTSPPTTRRWVAASSGSSHIVGYAMFWLIRLQKFRIDVLVHPSWRCQGIGSRLLAALLEDLQAAQAATVQARAWEEHTEVLQFLQRRGFRETHRMRELRLNLQAADLTPFAGLIAQTQAQGTQITTLQQEEATDAQCWRKLLDLQNAVLPDWPDPDPGPVIPWTLEDCRHFFSPTRLIPPAFFIAKAGDAYIGYSGLAPDPHNATWVEVAGTAVRPEYRGRGLATVLKVHCMAYAQRQGYLVAATRSANPAMIRVNEKVGFQQGRAEVRLVKRLPVTALPNTPGLAIDHLT